MHVKIHAHHALLVAFREVFVRTRLPQVVYTVSVLFGPKGRAVKKNNKSIIKYFVVKIYQNIADIFFFLFKRAFSCTKIIGSRPLPAREYIIKFS